MNDSDKTSEVVLVVEDGKKQAALPDGEMPADALEIDREVDRPLTRPTL